MSADAIAAGGLRAGRTRVALGRGYTLRLLSAMELLRARGEAQLLAEATAVPPEGARERALCANACLLARALERHGHAVFADGAGLLARMTTAEIGALTQRWAAFNRGENPSPADGEARAASLKKAWSTRLMSAFSGACSAHLGHCPPRRARGA